MEINISLYHKCGSDDDPTMEVTVPGSWPTAPARPSDESTSDFEQDEAHWDTQSQAQPQPQHIISSNETIYAFLAKFEVFFETSAYSEAEKRVHRMRTLENLSQWLNVRDDSLKRYQGLHQQIQDVKGDVSPRLWGALMSASHDFEVAVDRIGIICDVNEKNREMQEWAAAQQGADTAAPESSSRVKDLEEKVESLQETIKAHEAARDENAKLISQLSRAVDEKVLEAQRHFDSRINMVACLEQQTAKQNSEVIVYANSRSYDQRTIQCLRMECCRMIQVASKLVIEKDNLAERLTQNIEQQQDDAAFREYVVDDYEEEAELLRSKIVSMKHAMRIHSEHFTECEQRSKTRYAKLQEELDVEDKRNEALLEDNVGLRKRLADIEISENASARACEFLKKVLASKQNIVEERCEEIAVLKSRLDAGTEEKKAFVAQIGDLQCQVEKLKTQRFTLVQTVRERITRLQRDYCALKDHVGTIEARDRTEEEIFWEDVEVLSVADIDEETEVEDEVDEEEDSEEDDEEDESDSDSEEEQDEEEEEYLEVEDDEYYDQLEGEKVA